MAIAHALKHALNPDISNASNTTKIDYNRDNYYNTQGNFDIKTT